MTFKRVFIIKHRHLTLVYTRITRARSAGNITIGKYYSGNVYVFRNSTSGKLPNANNTENV